MRKMEAFLALSLMLSVAVSVTDEPKESTIYTSPQWFENAKWINLDVNGTTLFSIDPPAYMY